MTKTMEHHIFSEGIPELTEPQFAELKSDISKHGQREAITLFEGKILDGRQRYRVCAELGIEPKFQDFSGSDPRVFVIASNLKRRQLNPDQLSVLMEARRKKIKEMWDNGLSVRQIAAEMGMNNSSVQSDLAKEGVHPNAPREGPSAPATTGAAAPAGASSAAGAGAATPAPPTMLMPKRPKRKRRKRDKKKLSKRRLILIISAASVLLLSFLAYGGYVLYERARERLADREMVALEEIIKKMQIDKQAAGDKWNTENEQKLSDAKREHQEYIDRFPNLAQRAFMKR